MPEDVVTSESEDEPVLLETLARPEVGADLRWGPHLAVALVEALDAIEGGATNAAVVFFLDRRSSLLGVRGFTAARRRVHRNAKKASQSLLMRILRVLSDYPRAETFAICVRRGDDAVASTEEVQLARRQALVLQVFGLSIAEYITVEPRRGPRSFIDEIDPMAVARVAAGFLPPVPDGDAD